MPLLALDLDNTIADRHAAFLVWAQRFDDLDYVIRADEDGFRPRLEFFADLEQHFGLGEPLDLAEYRAVTHAAFPPIDPHVAELLSAFRTDGWRVVIVTNGESGVQEATAETVGVTPLVDAVLVSGTVGIRKPDRRLFELAGDLTDGWMIGDGDPDVEGARNAGLRSVWLARGRTWQRTDLIPDHIAPDIASALRLVRSASQPTGGDPMDEAQTRSVVEAHAAAVVDPIDVAHVQGDMIEELHPALPQIAELLPQPVTEANVDSLDFGDGQAIAVIRYTGTEKELKIKSTWEDRDGTPKIVHAEPQA